jgi:hypothetical protein
MATTNKPKTAYYGTIEAEVWTEPSFKGLSDSAKLLFAYLKSNQHQNIIGCFYCPDAYIESDLGWNNAGLLAEAQSQLIKYGFADFCELTDHVYLKKHLEKFPIPDLNRLKGAVSKLSDIPKQCLFVPELAEKLSCLVAGYAERTEASDKCEPTKQKRYLGDASTLLEALEGLARGLEEPCNSTTTTTTTTPATTPALISLSQEEEPTVPLKKTGSF